MTELNFKLKFCKNEELKSRIKFSHLQHQNLIRRNSVCAQESYRRVNIIAKKRIRFKSQVRTFHAYAFIETTTINRENMWAINIWNTAVNKGTNDGRRRRARVSGRNIYRLIPYILMGFLSFIQRRSAELARARERVRREFN